MVDRYLSGLSFTQGGGKSARDLDFERRQERLAGRQQTAKEQPKGTVECTFPQKGNKVVMAKQGEPLGKVVSRSGLRVKFDCKVCIFLEHKDVPTTSLAAHTASARPCVHTERAMRNVPGPPER